MVICLEGPSAVGKTTLAKTLAECHDAVVIPEVNALFDRPSAPSPTWYLERQVDRWALAREAAQAGRLAVLDGDPFQPYWYGWAYSFQGWQPLDLLTDFYRPQIAAGHLAFPDRYFLLTIAEDELRARKASDTTRSRRGFEEHLRFIAPQQRYFAAMARASTGRVHLLPATDIVETADRLRALATEPTEATTADASLALLDTLTHWLSQNHAAGVVSQTAPA